MIKNKNTNNKVCVLSDTDRKADKDMRKMSNIVENLIRRYVESRV